MRFVFIMMLLLSSLSVFAGVKTNPDISLNSLFLLRGGTEGNSPQSEKPNGFSLQEAELRLTSNIDTYFRGDVVLALEKEASENPGEEGKYIVEPEEAFVETLGLEGISLRIGKFYPFWGRSNQWHTHSFPFIDTLQTREAIFGEEGFNESGLAVSYLFPLPWYTEFVAQAFSAQNRAVFGSNSQDDWAGVYFLKSLWDLSELSTLELDLGYGNGRDLDSRANHIYNAALTYKNKWSSFRTLVGTAEYTLAQRVYDEAGSSQGRRSALSSWLQYQFSRQWWVQGRHEIVFDAEKIQDKELRKNSVLVAFVPSEYSAIRLQYDNIDNPSLLKNEERVTLQFNFSMGTHPSHNY
ncbi:MAG: hypothetical protein KDD35_08980 [Bdellovibrionales bacterium]|nr:hypothetical protein [Bdellovibrionales bacterium]